jgi:hypothetical protein
MGAVNEIYLRKDYHCLGCQLFMNTLLPCQSEWVDWFNCCTTLLHNPTKRSYASVGDEMRKHLFPQFCQGCEPLGFKPPLLGSEFQSFMCTMPQLYSYHCYQGVPTPSPKSRKKDVGYSIPLHFACLSFPCYHHLFLLNTLTPKFLLSYR